MATPPIPMPTPGAGGAPPKPPGAGGIGMPGSPLGGPAGPGASPMVSPGTGAGMQARALARTKQTIETLMEDASAFEPGTPQFNAYMGAIRTLNGVFKAPSEGAGGAKPLPVPATPPGAGVGGVGTPPSGLPPAGGGGGGGAGPIEPAM